MTFKDSNLNTKLIEEERLPPPTSMNFGEVRLVSNSVLPVLKLDFENKEEDDDSKLAAYDLWTREKISDAKEDEDEDNNT